MKHFRANSVLSARGDRLAGVMAFRSCPPPPPGGQVRTAPVVSPPATGADGFLTQGSAAAEARAAHNREVAGSTPAPATRFQAKASEDNGATGKATMRRADCMTGEASRVDAGRTASATSDHGRDSLERQAPIPSCAGGVGSAARETAPAEPTPPAHAGAVILPRGDASLSPKTVLVADTAGTVTLSEASAFILSLVAAHEGRAPGDVLALLIAGAAEAIGIHSLIMRDAHEVDLVELPDFARRAANRFRGGGP